MLTILCITKAEAYAAEFLQAMSDLASRLSAEFVVAADGEVAIDNLRFSNMGTLLRVHSKGFLESALEDAVDFCHGDYILRLDDDEKASHAMTLWLEARTYESHDHWKFPRMNLWETQHTYITNPPLWPDFQTRLSVKAKSGGRHLIHCGSPFGEGREAPVAIEHYKFLVKSYNRRAYIAQIYNTLAPEFVAEMLPFSLPEDVFKMVDLALV